MVIQAYGATGMYRSHGGTGSHNCDKTDIGHEVPLGSIHSAIGHMVYISIVNISIMT